MLTLGSALGRRSGNIRAEKYPLKLIRKTPHQSKSAVIPIGWPDLRRPAIYSLVTPPELSAGEKNHSRKRLAWRSLKKCHKLGAEVRYLSWVGADRLKSNNPRINKPGVAAGKKSSLAAVAWLRSMGRIRRDISWSTYGG